MLSPNLFRTHLRMLWVDVADDHSVDVGVIGEHPSVRLAYPAGSQQTDPHWEGSSSAPTVPSHGMSSLLPVGPTFSGSRPTHDDPHRPTPRWALGPDRLGVRGSSSLPLSLRHCFRYCAWRAAAPAGTLSAIRPKLAPGCPPSVPSAWSATTPGRC